LKKTTQPERHAIEEKIDELVTVIGGDIKESALLCDKYQNTKLYSMFFFALSRCRESVLIAHSK
jgi:hypothetical protein